MISAWSELVGKRSLIKVNVFLKATQYIAILGRENLVCEPQIKSNNEWRLDSISELSKSVNITY